VRNVHPCKAAVRSVSRNEKKNWLPTCVCALNLEDTRHRTHARTRKHVTCEGGRMITEGFGRSIEWRNRTLVYYPKEAGRPNIVRQECKITESSTCPSSSSLSREQPGLHIRKPRGRLGWFWPSTRGICRHQSSCALPRPVATAVSRRTSKIGPECLKGLEEKGRWD
jgi:hypothetical protein